MLLIFICFNQQPKQCYAIDWSNDASSGFINSSIYRSY